MPGGQQHYDRDRGPDLLEAPQPPPPGVVDTPRMSATPRGGSSSGGQGEQPANSLGGKGSKGEGRSGKENGGELSC